MVGEIDLEKNFELVKEVTFAVLELWACSGGKNEIPNLAGFEAG